MANISDFLKKLMTPSEDDPYALNPLYSPNDPYEEVPAAPVNEPLPNEPLMTPVDSEEYIPAPIPQATPVPKPVIAKPKVQAKPIDPTAPPEDVISAADMKEIEAAGAEGEDGDMMSELQDLAGNLEAKKSSEEVAPAKDELTEAQSERDRLMRLVMMAKGGERIGSAIAGTKSDSTYMDPLLAVASNKTKDIIEKRDQLTKDMQRTALQQKTKQDELDNEIQNKFNQEKNDKDSPMSSLYRSTMSDTLKEANMSSSIKQEEFDKLSAAQLEKLYPNIVNLVNTKMAREGRIEAARAMNMSKKDAHDQKLAETLTKQMMEGLDPDKARAGNFAKNQQQIYLTERLQGLYNNPDGSIRDLDSRQMEELAIGLSRLLSGTGSGARSQVEALVPKTVRGNTNKMIEYIANIPKGMGQKAFVSRMAETIEREKGIAQRQVKNAQISRLSAYSKLKEIDPDSYNSVLSAYGLSGAEAPSNDTVIVREKSTGRQKKVSKADAAHILKDSKYEQVGE